LVPAGTKLVPVGKTRLTATPCDISAGSCWDPRRTRPVRPSRRTTHVTIAFCQYGDARGHSVLASTGALLPWFRPEPSWFRFGSPRPTATPCDISAGSCWDPRRTRPVRPSRRTTHVTTAFCKCGDACTMPAAAYARLPGCGQQLPSALHANDGLQP
jgi:hypothetical protein